MQWGCWSGGRRIGIGVSVEIDAEIQIQIQIQRGVRIEVGSGVVFIGIVIEMAVTQLDQPQLALEFQIVVQVIGVVLLRRQFFVIVDVGQR